MPVLTLIEEKEFYQSYLKTYRENKTDFSLDHGFCFYAKHSNTKICEELEEKFGYKSWCYDYAYDLIPKEKRTRDSAFFFWNNKERIAYAKQRVKEIKKLIK